MNIKIVVVEVEDGGVDWPKENAIEFLAWVEEKINSIPEEFRSNARVEIKSEMEYDGDHYPSIEIYYYRPETDEEAMSRRLKDE